MSHGELMEHVILTEGTGLHPLGKGGDSKEAQKTARGMESQTNKLQGTAYLQGSSPSL